jgi:hypothetical protein
VSDTNDHENIAGEHDSKQIDSQHIDIEEEHNGLIQSHGPAGWYLQADGRQRYWDGQQWTENYTPAAVTTKSAEGDGKPSLQRKRSSRVLIWILAGVTGISFIITALVQVNINSTVTAKDAVIATAHHARDVANAKADVANAKALVIENQLASVGAEIQTAANRAAAKIAADKAAAAEALRALYKGFTDKLESQLVKLGRGTKPNGTTVRLTAASCTVMKVNAAGGGTYSCDVTFSDGSSQTGTFTVPANGDWTRWAPPKK